MNKLSKKGFTLIELLIVIVIIGILAGVLLTVLDPAQQIAKAEEATMGSNVEKLCLALNACAATTSDVTSCNLVSNIGINGDTLPQSNNAAYAITPAGNVVTITCTYTNANADNNGCVYTCNYDFSSGTSNSGLTITTKPYAQTSGVGQNCAL